MGTFMFQFHYGSIKGLSHVGVNTTVVRFNSTMVRLKAFTSTWRRHVVQFQFHYGSIKGW